MDVRLLGGASRRRQGHFGSDAGKGGGALMHEALAEH